MHRADTKRGVDVERHAEATSGGTQGVAQPADVLDGVDGDRHLGTQSVVSSDRPQGLDGVFEGLRQLHGKIREEAQRRAAGRPERSNDVKLSRGGIREIEFIVQLLLVVRGGQFPEIGSPQPRACGSRP